MARNQQDEILRFLVKAEGSDALEPFLRSVRDLEGASDETRAAANKLLEELSSAGQTKAAIDSFQKLGEKTTALAAQLDAARTKADQLGTELASTVDPTKKQTQAAEAAARAARQLQERLTEQRDTLSILGAKLAATGVNTDDLAAAQQHVVERSKDARQKLEQLAATSKSVDTANTGAAKATEQLATKTTGLRKVLDGARAKLSEIAEGVGGLSTKFTELNQATELAGKALSVLSDVGGFLGDQVQGVGDYQLALAQVEVRTRATAEESKRLRQAIQDVLQNTAVSATAAADALRLMTEDGASATQAADNLGRAAQYAQANTRGLSDTVLGLGAVLDVFGEGADQIGALADQITATAAAAGTSTKAIEEGLAGAGVAAEQANLSMAQTVALIGVLAQRGVEGTRAGAQLTKVLQELADPASAAGEALKQAGLDGSNLAETLLRLAEDSTAAETVLAALGDKPRAALKLLLTEGGGSLRKFAAEVENASGAAAEASAIMGDKFTLALQRAQAAIENARNTFLEPILEPLAQELNQFATEFNTFANSPEFARLADQFRRVSTAGIQALGELVRSIDLEAAAGRIADFASATITAMEAVATVVNATATVFGTVWDAGAALGNSAVDVIATANAKLIGSFGEVSETAREVAISYQNVADDARRLRDEHLTSLGNRFGLTSEEAKRFGEQLDVVGTKAIEAAADLDRLAAALPANDILAIANRWGLLAKNVSATADASMQGEDGLKKLKAAALDAAIGFERLRIATLSAAIADLARAGQENTETFAALVRIVGEAEANVRKLTEEQASLTESTDRVSESADRAAGSVRNYGNAAGDAARATRDTADSNSQVSETFGNIARQSSETAISLGNITELFALLATAAAGAAKSAGEYARTISRAFDQAEEQDKRIAQRIELLQRQNAALDEEVLIRRRLEQQYGTSSVRLDELVQLELQRLNQRKESLALGDKEIAQEKERQSLAAGGINYGNNGDQGGGSQTSTQAAGKTTTVELVVRNEQTAAGGSTRIPLDQLDLIARQVLDVLKRDMTATGR
jgi:TP901 family phage tail tape measure protein